MKKEKPKIRSKFIAPDNDDYIFAIKHVKNGYVVQTSEPGDDEPEISEYAYQAKNPEVYSDGADRLEEIKAFQELVYHLSDFLGISYSKRSKYNFTLNIEPGEDASE